MSKLGDFFFWKNAWKRKNAGNPCANEPPILGRYLTAFTCAICSSLVEQGKESAHADWHERLRRAVDETETLG